MNPGATTLPLASMTLPAAFAAALISAGSLSTPIRSAAMTSAPGRPGDPVPSTSVPPLMTMSKACTRASWQDPPAAAGAGADPRPEPP